MGTAYTAYPPTVLCINQLIRDYGKRPEANKLNLFKGFGKIFKTSTLTQEWARGIVRIGAKIAWYGRNVRR